MIVRTPLPIVGLDTLLICVAAIEGLLIAT